MLRQEPFVASILVVVCLLTCTCRAANVKVTSCAQTSPCACTTEYGKIDLQPLAGDGEPGLKTSGVNTDYYYNPCENVEIGRIRSAGAAMHETLPDLWYQIGDNANVKMEVDGGNVMLTTSFGARSMKINLICDDDASSPTFTYKETEPDFRYHFDLTSEHCCPEYSPPDYEEEPSLGTIICVVLLVVIVLYLVVGFLIQTFVFKSQGIERIPNVHFWMAIPGLAKDGLLFVYSCIRPRTYTSL